MECALRLALMAKKIVYDKNLSTLTSAEWPVLCQICTFISKWSELVLKESWRYHSNLLADSSQLICALSYCTFLAFHQNTMSSISRSRMSGLRKLKQFSIRNNEEHWYKYKLSKTIYYSDQYEDLYWQSVVRENSDYSLRWSYCSFVTFLLWAIIVSSAFVFITFH